MTSADAWGPVEGWIVRFWIGGRGYVSGPLHLSYEKASKHARALRRDGLRATITHMIGVYDEEVLDGGDDPGTAYSDSSDPGS